MSEGEDVSKIREERRNRGKTGTGREGRGGSNCVS